MTLIGLDIGTSGCKAVLFDEDGRVLAIASREYAVDFPHKDWAEQDAERVWQLAQEALHELAAGQGRDSTAIGLSVQGEAVIPVGANGQILRPAILGMDMRTGAQNDWLRERFGARELFQMTGMPVHTINTLPKLLWLREHEPKIWQNTRRFFLYEDFLIFQMTGETAISRCLASRTQLFNLRADRWSEEILGVLELSPDKLSKVLPSGTAVATMRPDLAERLGFSRPPLIATGGHDQSCGAMGAGITHPGIAEVSSGTAEVVEVGMASPNLSEPLYTGNISVYAHTVPGMYVTMTLNHSGGLLLRWFRDTLGQEELRRAQETGEDPYDLLLANAPAEPTNLLVLPHFSGSGTPTFDIESLGAVVGLTFANTKGDLARAMLEGLTYELRLNLDLLREGGVEIQELRAIGGGARSPLWLQLKADITGIPVMTPKITEAAAFAAAVLAGQAAGVYPSAAEAIDQLVTLDHCYEPNPTRQEQYTQRFQMYRQLYPTLKFLNHQLHGISDIR